LALCSGNRRPGRCYLKRNRTKLGEEGSKNADEGEGNYWRKGREEVYNNI
jgi:hypothetical protein